jgi:hypothetical protein
MNFPDNPKLYTSRVLSVETKYKCVLQTRYQVLHIMTN